MKKFLLILSIFFLGTISYAQTWVNDSRDLFQRNGAVVLTVNLRNFSAVDLDGNGIIQPSKGETSGNFINAISRLDEMQRLGINTLHILPLNPTGVRRSYGTAGSVFATADFTTFSQDFKSPEYSLIVELQAKEFVDACHKRNIRVLVEVPAFASFDLYLKKPTLFFKDNNRNSIIPLGQKDVRVLNPGTNHNLNSKVYTLYEKYLDLLLSVGVDGVIVQYPSTKPSKFWHNLISHVRSQNPQFLFIAEMSSASKNILRFKVPFLSLSRILSVGFDGFYADFNSLGDWQKSKDLFNRVSVNKRYLYKNGENKSVLGSFASYNDMSPILVNDSYLSKMMIWLNSTLPVNSIYLDGFQYGDDYNFEWANLKALDSRTEDSYYFVNRGKIDLYNFSRRPSGNFKDITDEFIKGNKFKSYLYVNLPNRVYIPLETNHDNVFAYALSDKTANITVIVVGSLDLENIYDVEIKLPKITSKHAVDIVKSHAEPDLDRNKFYTVIAPFDIQVFSIKNFAIN